MNSFESRLRGSVEDRIKVFETTIEQPIILAIRSLDPSSVFELIKCGADVNAMPSGSKRILHHGNIGQKGEYLGKGSILIPQLADRTHIHRRNST